MPSSRRGAEPWLLGAAAALFYLCFHSTFYNFDGVACAMAVDLGDLRYLLHGNHLLYGPAALAFARLWNLLGYEGPALLPLQVLDSLLGGLGIALFARLLLRLGLARPLALLASAALAISHAWWLWSLEAQVYLLGACLVLLAVEEGLRTEPRPAGLGALHGLAVLAHVGHATLGLFCLLRLRPGPKAWRRLALYAAGAAGVLAAGYALAAWGVRPADAAELRSWLLGSLALPADKRVQWHGGWSLGHLGDWLDSSFKILVAPGGGGAAAALGWLLAALPLAAAAWGALRPAPARRELSRACLAWLLGYFILFSSWQPFVLVYRITDLPAVWLLAVLALERLPRRLAVGLLAAWTAAAGLYNGALAIGPKLDSANNAEYQEAVWLKDKAPAGSWVVVSGLAQVYVPYFAHLKPLNLRYFEGAAEAALGPRLDALAASGEEAFITAEVLAAGPWRAYLEGYGLEKRVEEGGRTLYRIRRKGSRAGAGRRS